MNGNEPISRLLTNKLQKVFRLITFIYEINVLILKTKEYILKQNHDNKHMKYADMRARNSAEIKKYLASLKTLVYTFSKSDTISSAVTLQVISRYGKDIMTLASKLYKQNIDNLDFYRGMKKRTEKGKVKAKKEKQAKRRQSKGNS